MTAHAEAVREARKKVRERAHNLMTDPDAFAALRSFDAALDAYDTAADRLESTLAPAAVVPSLLQRVLEREHETAPVVPPPRFKHDCERCVFLGRFEGVEADPRVADLYWCAERTLGPTLIARWSDDGPDYSSGVVFASSIPAIDAARRFAEFKGLPLAAPAAGTAEPYGWLCESVREHKFFYAEKDADNWFAAHVDNEPTAKHPLFRAPLSTGAPSRTVAGWPDETLNAFCADDHVAVWYNANSMGDEERCPVCLAKDAAAPSSGAPEVTALHSAALALYEAGRWTCGLSPEREARLWIALRDALGLEPGHATQRGVAADSTAALRPEGK